MSSPPDGWENGTKFLLIICALLLIAYDVYVMIFVGERATISKVAYAKACEHPIIAFALGIIVGHVFWPHQ